MRALVILGGGAKGASSVGIIKNLILEKKLSWDIISGISAGALNGAFLAQFKKEEQVQGILNLEKIWRNIKGNKSIYKPWLPLSPTFFGYITSFWTGGLFNTKPLKKLVKKHFNQKNLLYSGVKLFVGAVSMTTGKCKFAREYDPDLADWIVASSAFPVAFPPVLIDNDLWADGGLKKGVSPLLPVLEYNPTEIDIILTAPMDSKTIKLTKNNETPSALSVAIRAVQILNDETIPTSTLDLCKQKGIKVNIYTPNYKEKIELLNFSPEIIHRIINSSYDNFEVVSF